MSKTEALFNKWQAKAKRKVDSKVQYRFIVNYNAEYKITLEYWNIISLDWQTCNHFDDFEALVEFLEN